MKKLKYIYIYIIISLGVLAVSPLSFAIPVYLTVHNQTPYSENVIVVYNRNGATGTLASQTGIPPYGNWTIKSNNGGFQYSIGVRCAANALCNCKFRLNQQDTGNQSCGANESGRAYVNINTLDLAGNLRLMADPYSCNGGAPAPSYSYSF